jgi:hypothetical protein
MRSARFRGVDFWCCDMLRWVWLCDVSLWAGTGPLWRAMKLCCQCSLMPRANTTSAPLFTKRRLRLGVAIPSIVGRSAISIGAFFTPQRQRNRTSLGIAPRPAFTDQQTRLSQAKLSTGRNTGGGSGHPASDLASSGDVLRGEDGARVRDQRFAGNGRKATGGYLSAAANPRK